MYAYGCARFCLARGDKAIAEELWPAIVWCLEYCRRQTTPDGVIASDTDELEGRLPTGKANLSTSSLCYGGLRSAADLGRALGQEAEARAYDQQADALAKAIDKYFGAKVEGFDTYRYYDGNDVLRSWICLPLCMGLMDRRDGTIAALFSPRLWTADGLASQAGDLAFWDRSTLYGLRGVFQAGETATGLRYLTAYTRRRLLGDHVPYPGRGLARGRPAPPVVRERAVLPHLHRGLVRHAAHRPGSFPLHAAPAGWLAAHGAALGACLQPQLRRGGGTPWRKAST